MHKATGKVSVPVSDFENFNMKDVPHITDVIQDKTGAVMKPWMKIFDDFCESLHQHEIKPLRALNNATKESIDF